MANINDTIAPKLLGLDPTKQTDIDKLMVRAPPVLESARCHLESVSRGVKHLETHSERALDTLSDPDCVQLAPEIVLLSIENSATFTYPQYSISSCRKLIVSAQVEELDGSQNEWGWSKSKLGANAILACSMAVCRAGAAAKSMPLYKCAARERMGAPRDQGVVRSPERHLA